MARDIRILGKYDTSSQKGVDTGDKTRVQQHLKEEVDINTIMKRFGATGTMPSGLAGGVYGDFTGVTDFDSAREAISRAEEGFMTLPAEVRERFGNDPGKLIALAQELSLEELNARLFPEVQPNPKGVAGRPGPSEPPVAPPAPVVDKPAGA